VVEAVGSGGRRLDFQSKFVIGADGINSLVAHRLDVRRPDPRLRRAGLVAHVEGIDGLTHMGEMHIGDGYYCGIAPFNTGYANAAMVINGTDASAFRREPSRFFGERLRTLPSLADRVSQFRLASPITSVGHMAVSARVVWVNRALLTGDAGGFYDPFTGQGIYRALRGGELAAQAIMSALHSGDHRGAFTRYAARRRSEFRGTWTVERLIQKFLGRPAYLDRLLRNLAQRPGLSDTLVRFTGDAAPAWTVMNPWYLLRVLC
jgi:flavin-dependent dehydrogenase